jgi:hypothetical protein
VWLAEDRVEGGQVALKVLHPHLSDVPGAVARLRREVDVARRIEHPGALVALGMYELDGHLALAMPVHRGGSLAEQVGTNGAWTASALDRLARDMAAVLSLAHGAGVLHRDVSPSNVLVASDGTAQLTDFGLARVGGRQTRTILATPGYAAPEVLEGRPADPRSDLYGLGAVLYFAATGTAPFDASSPAASLRRQLDGDYLSLPEARPDLPRSLTASVTALLEPDPGRRPSSARALVDLLDGRSAPAPSSAPLMRKPELPSGDYTVIAWERGPHQTRRQRERAERRGDLGLFERIAHRVGRGIEDLISPREPPEEAIVRRIGELAGLPPASLQVPPAVYEPRFELVRGVSAEVAAEVEDAARQLGFGTTQERARWQDHLPLLVGTVFLALAAMLVWGTTVAPIVAVLLLVGASPMAESYGKDQDLPIAFSADLTPRLQPEVRARLTQTAAARPSRPREHDPDAQAVSDASASIDALRAAIDAADGLAPGLASDLRASAAALSTELGRLDTELRAAKAVTDERRADRAEEAVERVQSRIRRLQTLQRGGQHVDERELASLQASVADHLETLAQADREESRRVRLLARVLDIGTAAREARRDLAAPAERHAVVEELRRTSAVGRAVQAEMRRL